MMRRAFKPFDDRNGRRAVTAILITFALVSALIVGLSIRATKRSQNKGSVVEVATRQRMLAQRYMDGILLVKQGRQADPAQSAALLAQTARALRDGGTAPAVPGDDDQTAVNPVQGQAARRQLSQELRLVADLRTTGNAILAGREVPTDSLTAGEHLPAADSIEQLRILASLTSNVSLNVARTIANEADDNINGLITIEVLLGAAGMLISLGLALALIVVTRRQSAHFRSLVASSTDLVLVVDEDDCRYVSESVGKMLGEQPEDLRGRRFLEFIAPEDRTMVRETCARGEPTEILFRVQNRFGEWRHLEAVVTDLRSDRWVRSVVLNARDVTERLQLEQELTRQAFHDGLTGLANRALFRDRLDQALVRSERSGERLAVLLLDLDGFKQVNDSLGHDAGDHLLRDLAGRLGALNRPSDTLARLGGDEFGLLLDIAGEHQATKVAERLLEIVSEPVLVAGRELSVGASVGISIHPGGKGSSEALIRDADVAMYAAKESGRGTYEVFHREMAREFGDGLGLEHELRLGLQRDEFSVHYQPEIALDGSGVIGAEALVRWNSPSRGQVLPGEFIGIAESSGLIFPLGEFVLREACRQAAAWREEGVLPAPFTMWVNLSGKQVSAPGVSELVQRELERSGLPPECLGLEITETAIVQGASSDQAGSELRELHDLGVKIAIDDFGTGFSSLGQLRHFPVDLLKVDRSFVQGIEHSPKDAAITANLVSLAHALGVHAIAEGIESDAQLDSMRAIGCDYAQGFLFARPVPADEAAQLIVSLGAAADPAPAPSAVAPT